MAVMINRSLLSGKTFADRLKITRVAGRIKVNVAALVKMHECFQGVHNFIGHSGVDFDSLELHVMD